MKYWLNVDKPTKKCTGHGEGCIYERGKRETPRKGVGLIKVDGGWLSFSSLQDMRVIISMKNGHLGNMNYQKNANA